MDRFLRSNSGSNYDMRAQLLDANGKPYVLAIQVNSCKQCKIRLCKSFLYLMFVLIMITILLLRSRLQKVRLTNCVMQKVSLAGQLIWGNKGVDLGAGLAPYPVALSTNEIAVAWNDNSGRIAYQKVSAAGVAAWSPAKTFTSNSGHIVSRAQVVANTNGKFSMVYQDQNFLSFSTLKFI